MMEVTIPAEGRADAVPLTRDFVIFCAAPAPAMIYHHSLPGQAISGRPGRPSPFLHMSDSEEDDRLVQRELTDDPKVSSAALCIQLQLVDQSFRPEFTHQCFPGERIRGYQPHQEVIPHDKRHRSYEEHDSANQELLVLVQLAPSCGACTVDVQVRKKRNLRDSSRSQSRVKRVKLVEEANNEDYESLGSETVGEEDSEFSSNGSDEDTDESDVGDGLDPMGETRQRRMSPAEISHTLKKALPNVKRRGKVDDMFLEQPVGVVLTSYERKGNEFCIALADGKEAASYHTSVQRLALLFIENADDVDVASQDGGYWKVLYLFRKHAENKKFSLAGYVTLFHFSAPFRKPLPGTIVRICQAVVLPPYQRSGHGRELLLTVHNLAQGKFDDEIGKYGSAIVEINVEDPAPGFVALRNLVDYEFYETVKASSGDWFEGRCSSTARDAYFEVLAETAAREMSRKSKLTVQQMQVVYEISRLRGLQAMGDDRPSDLEENDKKFRLMVKKRLNRDKKEELSLCRNKEAMKELLDEMYREQRAAYEAILKRVK